MTRTFHLEALFPKAIAFMILTYTSEFTVEGCVFIFTLYSPYTILSNYSAFTLHNSTNLNQIKICLKENRSLNIKNAFNIDIFLFQQ